jgi:hypothetical protein
MNKINTVLNSEKFHKTLIDYQSIEIRKEILK